MRALAAVEFGYGYTKWMLRASDGAFRREVYPSAAPAFRDEAEIAPGLDVTPIRVGDKLYAVGPDSILAGGEEDPLAPRSITPDVWLAVHLGALARMGEQEIALATTMGPGRFYNHEVLFWSARSFEVPAGGRRNAPRCSLSITGAGHFGDESATQDDLESTVGGFDADETCFFSLGTGILSVTYAGALEFGDRYGTRVPGGMRAVYDHMDVELSGRLGRTMKTPTHVYDRALAAGNKLVLGGRDFQIGDVLERSGDTVINRLLDEAEEVVGGLRRARWVAMTGGAAAMLRAPVRRRYPWLQPVASTEPQWCTVRGMLRSAMEQEQQDEQERLEEQELARGMAPR